jgi:hypothetical protein
VTDDQSALERHLDSLSDGDLLRALNATLAKRQTPPTPEQLQALDDDRFYESLYPATRQPGNGPLPIRPDDESS